MRLDLTPALKPALAAAALAVLAAPARSATDLSAFFGTWDTRVPGAAWRSTDASANTVTDHLSAGAQGSPLTVRRDGSFAWRDTKGRWAATGEGLKGWPIVLKQAIDGHDWKVGLDTRAGVPAGRILAWDGFTWYEGRKR